MALMYQQFQSELGAAFNQYRTNKQRAAEILEALADVCVKDMVIPRENIRFCDSPEHDTDDGGSHLSPYRVITRNLRGEWSAFMCIRVDTRNSSEHTITYVRLVVRFIDGAVQLSAGDDDHALEWDDRMGVKLDEQLVPFRGILSGRVLETINWLKTGVGNPPRRIGFGAVEEDLVREIPSVDSPEPAVKVAVAAKRRNE
jgi:hypothetical protein